MKKYFLDANAHVPVNLSKRSQEKLDQILRMNYNLCGHPLSPTHIGTSAAIVIEDARNKFCELLGISNPNSLCFTHSCTEANDWACKLLTKHTSSEVFVSPFEHFSMSSAVDQSIKSYNTIPINKEGYILDYISTNSICMHVQNEIGIICDLKKIRKNTKNIIISDMAQSVGKLNINLDKSDVDIVTFGAHKFGGLGVGFLYLKDSSMWEPYSEVGISYNRDISGTPNIKDIVISSLALQDAIDSIEQRDENCIAFRELLESGLHLMGFEIVCVYNNRINNTTFVKIPTKIDGILLIKELSNKGVFVSNGSACNSFIVQTSNVMKALGDNEPNSSFIRFSQFGEYNEEDAAIVLDKILETMNKIG